MGKALLALIPFCLAVIFCCGCQMFPLAPILRIKAVSDHKEQQVRSLRLANQRFTSLLETVHSGTFPERATHDQVRKRFGDPIAIYEGSIDQGYAQRWVYRYAEDFWHSEKVYLFFDDQGYLLSWEYRPAPILAP